MAAADQHAKSGDGRSRMHGEVHYVKIRQTSLQCGRIPMHGVPVEPLVALIAGVLILFNPRLLNYVVAIYLIVVGVLGLVRVYG